jgi:sugar lactone lactonase YvrE
MGRNAVWTFLIALALAGPAHAAAGDTIADRVLGQRRFSTSIPYFVDGKVFAATDIAIDRSATPNRVWLADSGLNRVLGWSDITRFRAGASADLVLGQPSLYTGTAIYEQKDCPSPPSATRFCLPTRVDVDFRGNLYVVDLFNFRVLEFDRPFAADRTADRVFGQRDFTSRAAAADSTLDTVNSFVGVSVDRAGNVWMVDPTGSRRVLELDDPITHDTRPDRVIEPGTRSECFGGGGPQDRLCDPNDVEVSPQGDLFVQDFRPASFGDPRLYIYRQPLATDLTADVRLDGFGHTGVVFDPAGNLYIAGGFFVVRFPAPIEDGNGGELLAGPFSQEISTGRPAMDSAGNIYSAGFPWPTNASSRVYIFDAPFQGDPLRVERAGMSDRALNGPLAVAVDRSSVPNHLYVLDQTDRVLGWRDAAGFVNGAPADLILDGNDPAQAAYAACRYQDHPPVNAQRFCASDGGILGGMAVDSRGNLWLSDLNNHRVLELDRPFDTDGTADRVLGQGSSFTTRLCNKGGLSGRSLCYPGALAFDRDDNLYVADLYNNRVLLFRDPLKGDRVADKVFGQPDFQHGGCGRPGARTLCFGYEEGDINVHFYAASGLAVDPRGNLYVSDSYDNRVLIFRDAAASDTVADVVLGQEGRFKTRLQGTGPRRFGGFQGGLAIGPGGELYVADTANDRLLVFDDPLRRDTADRVFGHAGFAEGGASLSTYDVLPPPTAKNLLRPQALAFDAAGNLYVADTYNNRVLAFDRP